MHDDPLDLADLFLAMANDLMATDSAADVSDALLCAAARFAFWCAVEADESPEIAVHELVDGFRRALLMRYKYINITVH